MPNERAFLRDIHIGAQCTLMLLALSATTLLAQDPWARADLETRRLPPSMFRRLPTPVRADLERRGCTVPQIWADTGSANVVTGHFRTTAKTDWAVLCSVHRVSIILVYWEGRADSVAELGSTPDKSYLQGVGGGQIGFSRAIGSVDARYIGQRFQRYGGPEPPPLDHEGINDAFVEKASRVWYWYQGKWLELTGSD